MALTDENGNGMVMPVQPMYGGGYGMGGGFGGGFGGDWGWIILLLLFAGGGWGNGFGGYGNMALGYDFPWLMNGQQGINNNVSSGFRDAQLSDGITSIRDGIGNLSTQLCNGFAGTTAAVTGAQNALAQQLYTNQISDLERSYAAQTANTQGMTALQGQLAQCCCDNRLATCQTQNLVSTENAATRLAIQEQTQAILDKLCQQEIEAKNDTIAQLRQELMFSRGQASQDVQTAAIRAGQATTANQLVAELRACPIPAMPVYGQTPIFTCNNGCGCGCSA